MGARGGADYNSQHAPPAAHRDSRHAPRALADWLRGGGPLLPPRLLARDLAIGWRWRAAQPMGRRGRGRLGLVAGSAERGLSWREKVGGGGGGGGGGVRGGGGARGAGGGLGGPWGGCGGSGCAGSGCAGGCGIVSGGKGQGWGAERGDAEGGGREPRGRCPPRLTGTPPPLLHPQTAPAMASSSPQRQPTIGFPRRRSSRRLAAAAPPAKSGPDPPAPRLSPCPRTSGPAEPGTRSPRAEALPLSPRKRLGEPPRPRCPLPWDPPGKVGGGSHSRQLLWVWDLRPLAFLQPPLKLPPLSGGEAAPAGPKRCPGRGLKREAPPGESDSVLQTAFCSHTSALREHRGRARALGRSADPSSPQVTTTSATSPACCPAPRPSAARRTRAAACSSGTPRPPLRSPTARGHPRGAGGRRPPGARGSLPAPGSSGRKVSAVGKGGRGPGGAAAPPEPSPSPAQAHATSRRSGCCTRPCLTASTPGRGRRGSSSSSCGSTSAAAGPAASTSPEPPGRGKRPV